MKILFAVAGEGMGHATRSKPLLDSLRKHKLRIFAGGKASSYLRKYFSVSWIPSLRIVYVNNSVSNTLTFLRNTLLAPLHILCFLRILLVLILWRPKVVITDFEPLSCYAASILRIPVIALDNESIITQGRYELPKGTFWNQLKVFFITKAIIPSASAYVIPSFFQVSVSEKSSLVHPPLRKELFKHKPSKGKHILVYQTSRSNTVLVPALKKTNASFVAYDFGREGKDGNITFKKFNEKEFFVDLASCRAVIANGGFSLLSEALYFKKPVLALPIKGQFEQVLNAHYLQKLGYGMMSAKTSSGVIKRFISKLPRHAQALKAMHKSDPVQMQRKLAQVIKRVTAK